MRANIFYDELYNFEIINYYSTIALTVAVVGAASMAVATVFDGVKRSVTALENAPNIDPKRD